METQFVMPGIEIRVKGSILEMRTDGERTETDSHDTERALVSLMRHAKPKGLLFDVRGATYLLPPSRWKERVRTVARLTREHPLALVGREDQRTRNQDVVEAQQAMGGQAAIFTSRSAARNWLDAVIAHPA